MKNIKLTIAYDGTDFHGWQIQPGRPTVQGILSDLLAQLTREPVVLYGAGRTDAGVHAWGQVASFHTGSAMTPEEFTRALNSQLPADVRVRDAAEVPADFHARWAAVAKTYRYRICRAPLVSPFRWRYVLHNAYPLDFAAAARAARLFEGTHDFTSFAASSGSAEDDEERITERTIDRSELLQVQPGLDAESGELLRADQTEGAECPDWIYVVRGRSFLRNMVRKMVGTLLEVGRGRLAPEELPRLLELRDRAASGPTAPPHGLCLYSVEYPD